MKRLALVLPLLLTLGGCSVYTQAALVDLFAPNVVSKGRDAIRAYCQGIATADRQALALALAQLSGQCKAINRTKAIVAQTQTLCSQVDKLSATQLVTASQALVKDWKAASTALSNGC